MIDAAVDDEISKKDTRFEESDIFTVPTGGVGDLGAGAPSSLREGSIRDPFTPETNPLAGQPREDVPANHPLLDDIGAGSDAGSRDMADSYEALVNEVGLKQALKVLMGDRHPSRVREAEESQIRRIRQSKGGYTQGSGKKGKRFKVPEEQMGSLNVEGDKSPVQRNLRRRVSRAQEAESALRRILTASTKRPDKMEEAIDPLDYYRDDFGARGDITSDAEQRARGDRESYKDSPLHQAARVLPDRKEETLTTMSQDEIDRRKIDRNRERLATERAKVANRKQAAEEGRPVNVRAEDDNPLLDPDFFADMGGDEGRSLEGVTNRVGIRGRKNV